jgi:hypothetical protein
VILELITGGFYAEPQEDDSVKLSIPGFFDYSGPGSPSMPVKRAWVQAMAGRKVVVTEVVAEDVATFTGLRPTAADAPDVIATAGGTVQAAGQPVSETEAFSQPGLYPTEPARVVSSWWKTWETPELLTPWFWWTGS